MALWLFLLVQFVLGVTLLGDGTPWPPPPDSGDERAMLGDGTPWPPPPTKP